MDNFQLKTFIDQIKEVVKIPDFYMIKWNEAFERYDKELADTMWLMFYEDAKDFRYIKPSNILHYKGQALASLNRTDLQATCGKCAEGTIIVSKLVDGSWYDFGLDCTCIGGSKPNYEVVVYHHMPTKYYKRTDNHEDNVSTEDINNLLSGFKKDDDTEKRSDVVAIFKQALIDDNKIREELFHERSINV